MFASQESHFTKLLHGVHAPKALHLHRPKSLAKPTMLARPMKCAMKPSTRTANIWERRVKKPSAPRAWSLGDFVPQATGKPHKKPTPHKVAADGAKPKPQKMPPIGQIAQGHKAWFTKRTQTTPVKSTMFAPMGGLRKLTMTSQPNQQSVKAWLHAECQRQIQTATWKHGRVFLELYAGTGPVGKQVALRGGAVLAFDTIFDKRFDLNNPEVQGVVLSWVDSGLVWGVWLGTDCTTWSTASYSKGEGWLNSYRTKSNLWGPLDQLSPKAKQAVLEGNQHATFSLNVLKHITDQPLAVAAMENPAGSVIWRLPCMVHFEKTNKRVFHTTCDYCQYGKPWRKPTKFLWVSTKRSLAPCKTCGAKKGLCSRTRKPHVKLGHGRCDPKTRKQLTKLAEPYPRPLAVKLADCLAGGPMQR
jgi:hypothetical protein